MKDLGIIDIIGDVIVGSEDIFTTHDSKEMVVRAKTLANITIGLIQSLQKEAETHSDPSIQVNFVDT